jgi:hypothetical protein
MSEIFEPRHVQVSDIPGWMRESWELFTRKPVSFLALTLTFYGLSYAARTLGSFSLLFAVLLCQIVLLVAIANAESADLSKKILLKPTFAMVRNVVWMLAFLALIYVLVFFANVIFGAMISGLVQGAGVDRTHTQLFSWAKWLWTGHVSFMGLYLGLVWLSLWFISPLMAMHEMDLRTAVSLAKEAERRNEWVIFVASYPPCCALGVLMIFLADVSMVAWFLFFPLFASYQYVIYRHVFLGRRRNKPVASLVSNARLATGVTGSGN